MTKLADQIPSDFTSNVVHWIPCGGCNSSYIVQTARWVKTRVYEHDKNINRKSDGNTVLTKHRIDKDHNFNSKEIGVLKKEPNLTKGLAHEMVHIVKYKTSISPRSDVNNPSAILIVDYSKYHGCNKFEVSILIQYCRVRDVRWVSVLASSIFVVHDESFFFRLERLRVVYSLKFNGKLSLYHTTRDVHRKISW